MGIGVQNVSNVDFQVNSLAGNAFTTDSSGAKVYVGNVSNFTPVSIPRNSQGIIKITLRLQLIGIVNELIQAFSTGNYSMDLILEARANVDKLVVPINQKYTVGL